MTAWPFAGSAGAHADGKMGPTARAPGGISGAVESDDALDKVCYAPLGIIYA
jgi:hypothetical protein